MGTGFADVFVGIEVGVGNGRCYKKEPGKTRLLQISKVGFS
jgi:hypothetical protein